MTTEVKEAAKETVLTRAKDTKFSFKRAVSSGLGDEYQTRGEAAFSHGMWALGGVVVGGLLGRSRAKAGKPAIMGFIL